MFVEKLISQCRKLGALLMGDTCMMTCSEIDIDLGHS